MSNHDKARKDTNVLINAFFSRFNAKDFDGVAALLHAEFAFNLPFDLTMPAKVTGTDATSLDRQGLRQLLRMFEHGGKTELTITEILAPADPALLMVRYESDFRRPNAPVYANRYIAIFGVREGKIVRWTEYHNPHLVPGALQARTTA